MVSLARASLVFEWRRYATAVLAVTFAGLLVIVQLALLLGLFSTVSAAVDESTADLWIGYRDTPSVDLGRPIRRDSDAAAWRHPEVTRIEPLVTAFGDLRRADGAPLLVTLNAIDSSDAALAFRRLLTPAQRAQLREPGAILVDAADLGKLQAAVGTVVEINGRRAHIAGVVEGIRAVGGITVLASHATVRRLAPETRDQVSYYLVGLRDPARAEQVVQQIGDGLGTARYSVWSAATLSQRSQAYWLLESGAGLGAGFASLLALLSGHLDMVEALSAESAIIAATQPGLIKVKLQKQLEELDREGRVDAERFAAEAALSAARADVREELDRLAAHVKSGRELLKTGSPAGRKIDFLAQELNREANTLCSKSASLELTNAGLSLKGVIDQFKEQAANVE